MRIKSLKKFLILSITISILIVEGAAISWSYLSITGNTARFFDVLLLVSAEKIKLFISGDDDTDLKLIQSHLDACANDPKCNEEAYFIPKKDKAAAQSRWTQKFTKRYIKDSVFQVWQTKPKKMLLHSIHAPREYFADFLSGYQEVEHQGNNWRVYTLVDKQLNITIQTAQLVDMRDDLAEMIIFEHIYPLLMFIPLLLLLIFVFIKLTGDIIIRISHAIKIRDPKNLNPLNIKNIPVEILPLVEELNRLFNLINHTFQREQRFNSDAAHELKTPLAAIKSQTQVALTDLQNNNGHCTGLVYESLAQVIRGIDRANHLVSQLLLLSRLSPDKPLDDIKGCCIDKIIREIIADHYNKAQEKNIQLSLNIISKNNQQTIPNIKGNEILLSILIRNLIDNAIRYSGNDSTIDVEVIVKRNTITLLVNDTGPGLSDELKQRVFDRFYRQPGTKTEGSGLGLSIVKLIAELHNATIKLKDNPHHPHGLSFNVIFKI